MAKTTPHPAARHVARAKAAAQAHHDQIMQHLANIEQAIGPQQDQQPDQQMMQQKGMPAGPSTGVTPPGGMSPLGGRAGG